MNGGADTSRYASQRRGSTFGTFNPSSAECSHPIPVAIDFGLLLFSPTPMHLFVLLGRHGRGGYPVAWGNRVLFQTEFLY